MRTIRWQSQQEPQHERGGGCDLSVLQYGSGFTHVLAECSLSEHTSVLGRSIDLLAAPETSLGFASSVIAFSSGSTSEQGS